MCNSTVLQQFHLPIGNKAATAKQRLAKASCGQRSKAKSVRFHGTVKVCLKQVSKQELKSTWYGPLEYKDFQRDSKRSLKAVSAKLVCGLDTYNAKEHCLRGLEACLSAKMYQQRKQEKTSIVRHVLQQQLLQKLVGVHDPELIAELSQGLSQQAQQRARLLAAVDIDSSSCE